MLRNDAMSSPSETPKEPLRPTEQLPIALFGAAVLAVRSPDGTVYLNIGDLCTSVGLAFSAQRRRIVSDEQLSPGLCQFRVQTARGPSTQDFLELERVPLWMLRIQLRRVDAAVQDRVRYVQDYLRTSVYAAFAQLANLDDRSSRQIEDLAELDRIDPTLQALAERQSALEASQDRARGAWRELRSELAALQSRMQELEQVVDNRLAPTQRRVIYDLVHAWAHARAEREPKLSVGQTIHACWAIVNARFRVTSYRDLPAAAYPDCVRFIQDAYSALTGEQLPIVEQEGMDFNE